MAPNVDDSSLETPSGDMLDDSNADRTTLSGVGGGRIQQQLGGIKQKLDTEAGVIESNGHGGSRRVAVAQMTAVGDVEKNYATCKLLVEPGPSHCRALPLPVAPSPLTVAPSPCPSRPPPARRVASPPFPLPVASPPFPLPVASPPLPLPVASPPLLLPVAFASPPPARRVASLPPARRVASPPPARRVASPPPARRVRLPFPCPSRRLPSPCPSRRPPLPIPSPSLARRVNLPSPPISHRQILLPPIFTVAFGLPAPLSLFITLAPPPPCARGPPQLC
ncbi:unnamed protein product [Closterium sp. Naga37s-1]|nr:unnamed protein product [Closterium sp. Naga37s-1]